MKRTTYIIIIALLIGAVAVGIFSAYLFGFGKSRLTKVNLTDGKVCENVVLPRFSTLLVNESKPREWGGFTDGHISLRVTESDSVKAPTLAVPSSCKAYVKTEKLAGDTLRVKLDFFGDTEERYEAQVTTDDFEIQLTVPRGMVTKVLTEQVNLGFAAVHLMNFDSATLTSAGTLPTAIENSKINTLYKNAYGLSTNYSYETVMLDLINTQIATMKLIDSRNDVFLKGDGNSRVQEVEASTEIKYDMSLRVAGCPMGKIKWLGSEDNTTFSVMSSYPFEATVP